MIYEIYLDGKILFYPDDSKYVVNNAVLTEALNDSGTLEFDIPATNPLFNSFEPRISWLQVKKDGNEIFYGKVLEVESNIDFTKHIYAAGVMAELFNSIQPQRKYQTVLPEEMLSALITEHNTQCNDGLFKMGQCTVTDPNDSIYHYTNYEDTLTAIREKLCETLDGYIKLTRDTDGKFKVNFLTLETYGKTSDQAIEFGRNLLDYSSNLSAQDIATAVIPLGARLEESTSAAVEGLDEYLTIVGTEVDDYHLNSSDDYVQIPAAVSNYGMVKVVKKWDDVTIASNLKTKAEAWLNVAQYESITLELSAVDLSMLNANIDSYDVGDYVYVKATQLGLTEGLKLPVQKKTTYLNDLSKNQITLGSTMSQSYTQQASKSASTILNSIPQTMTLLETAKKEASDLINGMLGNLNEGNMRLVTADDGHITEIVIADNEDLDKAVKVWRWNINGLGYSSTGYSGSYNTAITNDGKINAAMILANTMVADMIRGGTLKLGGYDNKYGKLELYSNKVKSTSSTGEIEYVKTMEMDQEGLYRYGEANGKEIKFAIRDSTKSFFSFNPAIEMSYDGTVGASIEWTPDIGAGSSIYIKSFDTGAISLDSNGASISVSTDADGEGTIFLTTGSGDEQSYLSISKNSIMARAGGQVKTLVPTY